METKSYNFSSISLTDLKTVVDIRMGTDEDHEHKFEEWFRFEYALDESENQFLEKLLKKHKRRLIFYLEDTLKVKFIGAIMNQVDFSNETIQDWYHASLSGTVNKVYFNGFADFVVAKGDDQPVKPYFFIQEFKPSTPDRNPEVQLLAEMVVALEKNEEKLLRGAYLIGQNWKFVILEKIGENKFEYFVSQQFDSLDLPDLKQIYINLQAVKLKYCVD